MLKKSIAAVLILAGGLVVQGTAFAQQQQQWENRLATLTGQVQDLQRQLQTLSASLQPLTAQLDSVVALYNSLPKS